MLAALQQTDAVRTRWAAAATVLVFLLNGCGEVAAPSGVEDSASEGATATESPGPSPAPSPSSSPVPEAGTTIVAATSEFGPILFDGTGQAIYVFDVEDTARPRCYDACAKAWPPVLTDGVPRAGRGVKDNLLGTTRRAGGRTQVTYRGHPLYFYANEGKREVKCHDVFENGGTWYAVAPNGRRAP